MNSFDIFRKVTMQQSSKPMHFDSVNKNKQNVESSALKGYLLNNNIKKENKEEDFFEYILQSSFNDNIKPPENSVKKHEYDFKNIIKPIALIAGITAIAALGISACISKYSGYLAKNKGVVRSPDLARNMNLVEEQDLAMYKLLRDPNTKNLLGLVGIGSFSMLTLSAKTLIDGIKDVWIKKQNCDIDYDLQENLIEVEKNAFSGKLKVVNALLNDCVNYFKSSLNEDKKDIEFKNFLSFKGEKKEENKKRENKLKPFILTALVFSAFCSVSYLMFKNYQKTAKNYKTFLDKIEDSKIRTRILNAQKNLNKDDAVKELTNIFKTINSDEKSARKVLNNIEGISENEINNIIANLKKEQIFAQTPEAMGGVYEKIQYYSYINQPRGHLYNWILNPENKWNKYLFISLSLVSSIGYITRSVADALKQTGVSRENSKSELNLRQRLVEVEINNFKAKKLAAITPMIDNYDYQKKNGKTKQELTAMAQNILLEIKNGPPYIYN